MREVAKAVMVASVAAVSAVHAVAQKEGEKPVPVGAWAKRTALAGSVQFDASFFTMQACMTDHLSHLQATQREIRL